MNENDSLMRAREVANFLKVDTHTQFTCGPMTGRFPILKLMAASDSSVAILQR